MQHLEATLAGDLGQLDGERQTVVGVPEQTVALDVDGVVRHAGLVRRKTERAFVTDEMDLVPAPGKFDA
jgi:hypothetical protein